MPAQLFLPRNACMHLILRIDCAQSKQHERETVKAVTGSQKQTTEIYSHRHSNLISTILSPYTDTPHDIHANLKPQSNEFE